MRHRTGGWARWIAVVLAAAALSQGQWVRGQSGSFFNQRDDRYRVLGLKRAREVYEAARAEYERTQRLAADGQVSQRDLERSRSQFADAEVNYHQSLLAVLFEQQFVSVVSATKSRTADGGKRVRLRLATTSGASAELRALLGVDDALFRSLQPDVVTNVYVSLANDAGAIVSQPYEAKLEELRFGAPRDLDFTLLVDLDAVTVNLIYGNGSSRTLKVFLHKDAGANRVAVTSQQFSQEAELGATASFDLTLEPFSQSTDTYALEVAGLPAQIGRTFRDPASNARLSQLRFNDSVATRRAALEVSLPDRPTEEVAMDRPIPFFVVVAPRALAEREGFSGSRQWREEELLRLGVGFVRLELVPRGRGRLLVRAPLLFHSVEPDGAVTARLEVLNEGTRRLDSVEVKLDAPPGWERQAEPALLPALGVGEERAVEVRVRPAPGTAPGRYELRVRTSALSDNQPVTGEDKTLTVEIRPEANTVATVLLALLLVSIVGGIVVLGIRLSRR